MSANYALADAIREAGMTQAGLAEELGVHRSCIGCYVTGKYEPRASRASRIARVLGTTVEALWPGEETR